MIYVFAPHKASFPDFSGESWQVLHEEPSGAQNAATRTPAGPLFKPFSPVSGPSTVQTQKNGHIGPQNWPDAAIRHATWCVYPLMPPIPSWKRSPCVFPMCVSSLFVFSPLPPSHPCNSLSHSTFFLHPLLFVPLLFVLPPIMTVGSLPHEREQSCG